MRMFCRLMTRVICPCEFKRKTRNMGKIFFNLFFQFLGAESAEANHFSVAFHAAARHARPEITIMAEQAVFLTVKGEGGTAMGAF